MAEHGLQTVLTPNAGNGGFTVLSPTSASAIANSIFLNQVNALRTPQIIGQQNRIQSVLQRELNKIGVDQIELTDLKEEADIAIKFIDSAISRANSIRIQLDSAIKTALQADSGDANSFPALASSFDAVVNSIINTANTGPSPNLLSEQPQSPIKFKTSTNGATFTINPVFLGTNYTITEDVSGDVFVRVDSTKTIHETNAADGTFTGNFAAIFGGIRLNSFDSSTNAIGFTFSPATAAATSYTGTLSKSGLGVGNAFIYDNLESQNGRNRAIADLEAAKITLDQKLIKFNAARAVAEQVSQRSEGLLDTLLVKTETATQVASIKIQGVATQAEKINQLNVNLLLSNQVIRQQLLDLIPVKGTAGKFTSALIDIFV